MRHVARRLRRCAFEKLSRLRGPIGPGGSREVGVSAMSSWMGAVAIGLPAARLPGSAVSLPPWSRANLSENPCPSYRKIWPFAGTEQQRIPARRLKQASIAFIDSALAQAAAPQQFGA
jgi:hypothetical protein